jgi:hypothetical protein
MTNTSMRREFYIKAVDNEGNEIARPIAVSMAYDANIRNDEDCIKAIESAIVSQFRKGSLSFISECVVWLQLQIAPRTGV